MAGGPAVAGSEEGSEAAAAATAPAPAEADTSGSPADERRSAASSANATRTAKSGLQPQSPTVESSPAGPADGEELASPTVESDSEDEARLDAAMAAAQAAASKPAVAGGQAKPSDQGADLRRTQEARTRPDPSGAQSGAEDPAGLFPADPSGFRAPEATPPSPVTQEKPSKKADDRAKELLQQYIDMMNRQQASSGGMPSPGAAAPAQASAGYAPSENVHGQFASVDASSAARNAQSVSGVAPHGALQQAVPGQHLAASMGHFGVAAQGHWPTGHPPHMVMAGPMGAQPMPGMTIPGHAAMPGMMMPGMMMHPGMLPMGAIPPPPTGPPMGPPLHFGGPLAPHAGPWLLPPGMALPPGVTALPPGVTALPPGAVGISAPQP